MGEREAVQTGEGVNTRAEKPANLHQDLFILVLSFFVLGMLVYELLAKPGPDVRGLIRGIDNFICFIFLGDLAIRLHRAPDKWKFMRWGWVDLISSIPFLDALRWGRAARVLRILRLLRAFRSMRFLMWSLFRDRSKGAVYSAVLITLLVLFSGALGVLAMEADHPEANIKTPQDALWWAFVTATTVGYGDFFPVTTEGRLIGTALMLTGISLLAVITGAIASVFVGQPQDPASNDTSGAAKPLSLEDLLAEVRALRLDVESVLPHSANPENTRAPDGRSNSSSQPPPPES